MQIGEVFARVWIYRMRGRVYLPVGISHVRSSMTNSPGSMARKEPRERFMTSVVSLPEGRRSTGLGLKTIRENGSHHLVVEPVLTRERNTFSKCAVALPGKCTSYLDLDVDKSSYFTNLSFRSITAKLFFLQEHATRFAIPRFLRM